MRLVAYIAVAITAVIVGVSALDRNARLSPRPEPHAARATIGAPDVETTDEWQSQSPVATRAQPELSTLGGVPVDLDGLSVRAFIDRWSPAARTGDANAAYRLYEAEALCARASRNERALRNGDAPTEGSAERKAIEADTTTLEAVCAGTSPAEADERLQFLTQAARSGNANAQIDYFIEGPYGRPYDVQAEERDPNVVAWKVQAIEFLKQAAMQNNRDALEYLAMAYFKGIVVPEDLETSLTYEIALARASNKDPNLALLATQLVKQLPEASVTRARVKGEALYRQCCSNLRP